MKNSLKMAATAVAKKKMMPYSVRWREMFMTTYHHTLDHSSFNLCTTLLSLTLDAAPGLGSVPTFLLLLLLLRLPHRLVPVVEVWIGRYCGAVWQSWRLIVPHPMTLTLMDLALDSLVIYFLFRVVHVFFTSKLIAHAPDSSARVGTATPAPLALSRHMTCLEQQLDELELLQSVFSQPGEYTADGATVEHSTAWVRRLTADLEPPIGRLSCALHLKVDAVSGELDSSGGDPASSPEGTAAEQCAADISMTLPHG